MIPMNDIREEIEYRFKKLRSGVECEINKYPCIKCEFWSGYKKGITFILSISDRDMEHLAREKIPTYHEDAYKRGWNAALLELQKLYKRHIWRMYL